MSNFIYKDEVILVKQANKIEYCYVDNAQLAIEELSEDLEWLKEQKSEIVVVPFNGTVEEIDITQQFYKKCEERLSSLETRSMFLKPWSNDAI